MAAGQVSMGGKTENSWKIDEILKAFKQEIESHEMCSFIRTAQANEAENYSASSLYRGLNNTHPVCIVQKITNIGNALLSLTL